MSCHSCSSVNEADFDTEIMIHLKDRRHLENPGVLAFAQMTICLDCGAARHPFSEEELTRLKEELGLMGKDGVSNAEGKSPR